MYPSRPQIEIAGSMQNVPFVAIGGASLQSRPEAFDQYLSRTGYRDLEWFAADTPTLAMFEYGMAGWAPWLIGSQHMTFNSGQGRLSRVLDYVGMARTEASLLWMNTVQGKLPRPAPTVYYPDVLASLMDQHGEDWLLQKMANTIPCAQPKAADYAEKPQMMVEELVATLGKVGINLLCADTEHIRHRDVTKPEFKWNEMLRSGRVAEVHAGVGRFDQARDPWRVVQELRAVQSGDPRRLVRTALGRMLVDTAISWQQPEEMADRPRRLVVEMPPWPGSVNRNARVVEGIAQILEFAGAEPLVR